MNLPIMRRGLSPEGCKIRDRHQGSLTIGIQGTTVHPAERGRTQNTFLQDSVRRLHEIQARCKERDHIKRSQPLKATRESSASTSSLKQVNALAPIRNGSAKLRSRSQNSEREGSAHSDYFSLTEEQIEPLITHPTHYYLSEHGGLVTSDDNITSNNECNGENILNYSKNSTHHNRTHQTNSQISDCQPRPASGSPVVLKPITSKLVQTMPTPVVPALRQASANDQMFVSESELTQGMRKMRVDNLMSKIKNQKPSCELDYNLHYKTIENQHKMLLDNSDRLSLYRSGDGSIRNEIDTQRSVVKSKSPAVSSRPVSSKMVRARSFDRDLSIPKTGSVVPKSNKSNNNNSKNNLPHPSSPQIRKRISKSNSNLTHTGHNLLPQSCNQDQSVVTTRERRKNNNYNRRITSPQSPNNTGYMANVEAFQRSKSNLEKTLGRGDKENVYQSSLNSHNQIDLSGFYSDNKLQCDEAGDVNVPSLEIESTRDVNCGTTISSSCDRNIDHQPAFQESKREEYHLNIRPESPSIGSTVDQSLDNRVFMEDFQDNAGNRSFDTTDFVHDESKDSHEMIHDDMKDSREAEDMRTSTPVPNAARDAPFTNSSPKLLKMDQSKAQTSAKSSLRRSQSLKNVHQRPGHPPPTYKKGKIPKYILARREEERRLKELERAVDPDCPPGHTPLPDHERRNTLHLLQKSEAEVMRELSMLPVAQDTLRVKKVRHDLEAKLTQIEDGLRIFSQPKVYVMNDE
nr:uncharacterized protein LOC123767342 [Procambarus clarkii]XP_045612908.1 uncharacterized protein LOC123767342 [Procambarus clarkii]